MGVGINQDADSETCADKIYKWYRDFNADIFAKKCDACLDGYIKDNEIFEHRIKALTEKRRNDTL